MCFYENIRFACGDWKWGNFKEHCQKEYRMGETCGGKYVYETFHQPNKCRFCEKLDTKVRKRDAEYERIKRWQAERKNPASIEKSQQTIMALEAEIRTLQGEIHLRRQNVGGHKPAPLDYGYSNGYGNSYSNQQYAYAYASQ